MASLEDEVYGGDFFGALGVSLRHEELLHLDVVVLAEELQEAEDAAECQLVVELSFYFELIRLVAEHLDQDVLLAIEVIIGVHYLIRKHSFLLVLLEFPDLDEEVADILDQLLEGHEGDIGRIVHEFSQDRVLAVRVAVE